MARKPDDRERATAPHKVELVTAPDEGFSLAEVAARGREMTQLAKQLRDKILAPQPRKKAPVFSTSQLAELCGIDRQRVNYLIKKGGELPQGRMDVGASREFSLEEVQQWVLAEKKLPTRGARSRGAILSSANFKGGSTKTSTAMCLAQGLSLRGRKVLLVDLDPQGSLTELCGYYADVEIQEEHTVAPFIASYTDDEPIKDLSSVVRPTYWNNVSLIPASAALFGSEFNFPLIVRKRPDFKIWTLLRKGLAPMTDEFDYVICDTAPSLSYLTVNALMAADSLIMPLVPESLDFISSMQFWSLFSDLTQMLSSEDSKRYDMIQIVLSKVDSNSAAVNVVRQWAHMAYGSWMFATEIPYSSAASTGALSFNTIFDQMKGSSDSSKKTIERLRGPLNALCEHIDHFYTAKWEKENAVPSKVEEVAA